ncbi:MAG: lytic transglycosylase domain-containing protein [Bacillota bacterium]
MLRSRLGCVLGTLAVLVVLLNLMSAYSLLVRAERRLGEAMEALAQAREELAEMRAQVEELERLLAPARRVQDLALEHNPSLGRTRAGELAVWITVQARRHGLDPCLVGAVVAAESSFRPDAVSPAGARGLMQLMPATARALGVDAGCPYANVAGGVRYLRAQLERFGSLAVALAAYNAGPARIARAGPSRGGWPRATRAYVARVMQGGR